MATDDTDREPTLDERYQEQRARYEAGKERDRDLRATERTAFELQETARANENARRKLTSARNSKRIIGRGITVIGWYLMLVILGAIAFGTGSDEPGRSFENLAVFTAIGFVLTWLALSLSGFFVSAMRNPLKASLKITLALVSAALVALFTPVLLIPFAVVSIAALVLTKRVFRKVY